jgi:hypothetical protein
MRRSRRTSGHLFWLYERSAKRHVRKVLSKDAMSQKLVQEPHAGQGAHAAIASASVVVGMALPHRKKVDTVSFPLWTEPALRPHRSR